MLAMKTLQGAGWLVFSRFLGRAIDFVTLLVLARILTPTDFGVAALAMSLIAVVDTILEIPVTQALMRLGHVDKLHLDTGFTVGVLRSLAFAAIILITAIPFSKFYSDPHLLPLLATLAIGPIAKGFYSPNMVSFGREMNFRKTFTAELIAKSCAFIAAIATVLSGGGYWAIVANYVVASLANTTASYVLAPYRPSLSLARLRDFSSFLGWFSASQIVAAVNWQFDRVLLGRFVDKATLGRYALASDFATLPTQSLVGPAMQPLMVAFSKINGDAKRMQAAFLKAARFAMLISAPICIGIGLTADLAVALLLGPQWHDAAPILQVLAPTIIVVPYLQALAAFSLAANRPNVVFKINVIDLTLRLILITGGLYFYSVEGVTAARGLIAFIMFGFYLEFSRRVAGVSVLAQLENLWKVALASAIMAIVVLAFRTAIAPLHLNVIVELTATASLGAAAYGGVLYGCGVRVAAGPSRLELSDVRW